MTNPHWIYTQTVKTFAAGATPAFEDEGELASTWGAGGKFVEQPGVKP